MRITLDAAILVRAHQNADGLARTLLLELLAGEHVLVLSGPRLLKVSKLQPEQVTEPIVLTFWEHNSIQVVKEIERLRLIRTEAERT